MISSGFDVLLEFCLYYGQFFYTFEKSFNRVMLFDFV